MKCFRCGNEIDFASEYWGMIKGETFCLSCIVAIYEAKKKAKGFRVKTRTLFWYDWLAMLIVFLIVFYCTSCGPANGQGLTRAIEIPSPIGVKCYAVLNGNDEPVGGSCVKE